jgi:hypothetical protein
MPSGLPVLPNLNGFSVKKKPIFATGMFEFMPGKELQVAQQAFPLWEFDLLYEVLRTTTNNAIPDHYFDQYATQYEAILVVFLKAYGQANNFLFDDLSDNSRTGQAIATGDGVTKTFRIVRTWYTGSTSMLEPIGELNQNQSFQFYDNGSPVSPTVDDAGENITFGTAPTSGHAITGDFFFYYKCRFLEDSSSFEEFLHDRWGNKALKFRSVKTTPQSIGNNPVLPVNGWSIQELEVPSGFHLTDDSLSWGCLAKHDGYLVGSLFNAGNYNFGYYWTLSNGGGIPLPVAVPYGTVPWKRYLAVIWWARASDYSGSNWAGTLVQSDNGMFQPICWTFNQQISMGASDVFPNQTTTELWGIDSVGNNAVGHINSAGADRAVWFTIANYSLAHTMDQLDAGKSSRAIAIDGTSNFIYGWDTDSSNLIQAVRWNKGDGSEALMDVPGGNLFSAAYCVDHDADYSGGKVITSDGHIRAIYWLGTSPHTLLPNLGSDTFGECSGISDGGSGLVKCGITGDASGRQRAAAWLSDVPTQLPMLFGCDPAIDVTRAWAINADGNLVAGTCTLNGLTRPVLWRLS